MTEIPKMIYGTAWKKERTTDCVKRALAAGFRAFDTANQPKHYHEPGMGEAFAGVWSQYPRETLFIQTKFTSVDGQDHRVPYDPKLSVGLQVAQSFESSCAHLGVTQLDSVLLHGPYNHPGLGQKDYEVWTALESLWDSGKARFIGVSNVNSGQLLAFAKRARIRPHFVQNRVYASRNWDASVRDVCREFGIHYQGFSLLTANPEIVQSREVAAIAKHRRLTPEQVVFSFCRSLNILPLTGTTDQGHMTDDIESLSVDLHPDEVQSIQTCGV